MAAAQAKEKISDLTENLTSKLDSQASIEKKFKEYEKYVHKHAKLRNKKKFEYLKTFNIKEFVDEHIENCCTKKDTTIEISNLRNYILKIKSEINVINYGSSSDYYTITYNDHTERERVNKFKDDMDVQSLNNFTSRNNDFLKKPKLIKKSCDFNNFNTKNKLSQLVEKEIPKWGNQKEKEKVNKKSKKICAFYVNQQKELEEKKEKLKSIRAKLSTGLTVHKHESNALNPKKKTTTTLTKFEQMIDKNSSILEITAIDKNLNETKFDIKDELNFSQTYIDEYKKGNNNWLDETYNK